jgi:hypothetical protein
VGAERLNRIFAIQIAIALILVVESLGLSGRSFAQTGFNDDPSSSSLAVALGVTRAKGVPTIVVFTSIERSSSVGLWENLVTGAWARSNRGLVQFVNVSREREPRLVDSMGVRQFPTVAVYRKIGEEVRLIDLVSDGPTADDLTARLNRLGLDPLASRSHDPDVKATSFGHEIYPSQQFSLQAPPVAAPPQQSPPSMSPPVQQSPPLTPLMAPVTPAGVIQVPSQHLVIQQSAPQVYLAPTQPPIVYSHQLMAPTSTPGPLYAPVASPSPAAGLFVPSTLAPVAPPMAAAPTMPVTAPAVAAAPTMAAVTNNTLSLPTSRASTRVRVRGPGFIGSSLARLGERLTQFGRAKVETIHETTLESPYLQHAGGGLTTISSTSAAPLSPPQTTTLCVPVPQQSPPSQAPPTQAPPMPTPQGSSNGHSLFHH